MLNACPKCSYELRLGDPGRGRYRLKCPKCATPLELTVFGESEKPPILAERAGTVDLPADSKTLATRSDVDDPSPAASSSRPEPNRHNLEAVVASSIATVSSDDRSRPDAPSAPAEQTIAMTSAFTAGDAGAQRGEATVGMDFDRGAALPSQKLKSNPTVTPGSWSPRTRRLARRMQMPQRYR